ncbi:MAG: hypothetical protein HZA79_05055 [Sphingobacteriales bacterium]|nr:hypothetical protein [Sphingobacteriales bacterium]
MAEELIDGYVDRGTVKQDTDFMITELNRVYTEFKKLDQATLSLSALKGGKEFATALEEVVNATKRYNAVSDDLLKNMKQQADIAAKAAKAEKDQAAARSTNATAAAKESATREKSNKERERESKLIDQAIDDYLQLSKAYNEAALKAKNYALRLGESHPITVQAVKDANDMSAILKRLDASVGQNHRNIGNYKSAFDGLGFSFTQVARELPSLTVSIQQFALAISNNLPMVADELKKAKVEISALKAEGKDAPSLFSRITKSLFSWQVGLSVVITAGTFLINMLRSTKKETKEVATEQETYAKNLADARKEIAGEVADVKVLVEQIKGENLTKSERIATIKELKRIAPEYFNLLNEEKSTVVDVTRAYDAFIGSVRKSVEARVLNKQLDEIVEKRLKLEDTLGIGKSNVETAVVNGRVIVKAIKATYFEVSDLADKQAEYNKLKLQEAEIVKRLAAIQPAKMDPEKKKKKDDSAKKAKEAADLRLQTLFEIQKIEIQSTIDYNKAIAEDESRSYTDRLEATRAYLNASQDLLNLEADTKKKIGKKTTEELLLIDTELADKLERLTDETTKMRVSIWKDGTAGLAKEETDLHKKLESIAAAGFKRFQDEQAERIKVQKDATTKLSEIKRQAAEDEKKLYQELYRELATLAQDFFTAQQDREIAKIQDKIILLETQKQKDIEVTNQTISNADEREKQISLIEARAAQEKLVLEKQKQDAERKKRDLEKIGQSANIIGDMAKGIVSLTIKAAEAKAMAAVLASNPLTAALAPIAIANAGLIAAQIPIVTAIGAAQLARLLIPRYKHGKNVGDAYEGPAIVGDGGKQELIIREDGSTELTSDKPQLTYVKKRDIVLADARKAIAAAAMQETNKALMIYSGPVQSDNGMNELKQELGKIEAAIKGKKELHLKAGDDGLTALWKYGANSIRYISENTNW